MNVSSRNGTDAIVATRKKISASGFNPTAYLENQISLISMNDVDAEKKLLQLFDGLTEHLAIVSHEIENESSIITEAALNMESILFEELDTHSSKLKTVGNAVDEVKLNFDHASEGAVRIGGRLANAEKERSGVERSLELFTFIQEFQNSPDNLYANILSMDSQSLRAVLPVKLQPLAWSELSKTMYDLKTIVQDINTDEIIKAQTIIVNITDVIEVELLGQFDIALNELMEQPDNTDRLTKTKSLSDCLHLFNNGLSIQKRYIFSVIQKRIPNDVFFRNKQNEPKSILDRVKFETVAVVKQLQTTIQQQTNITPQRGGGTGGTGGVRNATKEDDETSSVGASDDDDNEPAASTEIDRNKTNSNSNHNESSPSNSNNNNSSTGLTASNLSQAAFFQPAAMYDNQDHHSLQLIDHLSGLFAMINKVCIEQFAIIRNIFPPHTIARVTRVLIQRIFSDPAFGIQARVDAILSPQPPAEALPISDYLDALLTIREKLTALNVLLLECAGDPALMGMGSESESLRKAKDISYWKAVHAKTGALLEEEAAIATANANANAASSSANKITINDQIIHTFALEEEMIDARMRSDNEIREFFDDQINQVLTNYVNDYFDKEMSYVRQQYVLTMRKVIDDTGSSNNSSSNRRGSQSYTNANNTKVSAGSLLQLPHIKVEKIKSITMLVKTIANKSFLNSIFVITSDAMIRMESIGRDNKKLSNYVKDLFLIQLGCLCDGILLPSARASMTILLKAASMKGGTSSNNGSVHDMMMPTMDILPVLATISYGLIQIKQHFQDHFQRPLLSTPNIIAICKEHRNKSYQMVLQVSIEAIHAWTLNISIYIEKLLSSYQSKYDFLPKFDPITTGMVMLAAASANAVLLHGHGANKAYLDPTNACDAICKIIIQVSNAVRYYDKELIQSFDMINLFWKPLGQQFIGILISHIRKYKISIEGGKLLLRDLEEYQNVGALMNCVETLDMLVCLREIGKLFICSSEDVVKMVKEDYRHLDTSIVLALLRSRADFTTKTISQSNHWSKILSTTFSNYKWESSLPWESKKPLTIVSFTESMSGNGGGRPLGPKTLRKSSVSLSALYINEAIRQQQQSSQDNSNSNGNSSGRNISMDSTGSGNNGNNGKVGLRVSMDLLDSGIDINRHLQSLEAQNNLTSMNNNNNNNNQRNVPSMRFLPSRPDEINASPTIHLNNKRMNGSNNSSNNNNAAVNALASNDYFQFLDTNTAVNSSNNKKNNSNSNNSIGNGGNKPPKGPGEQRRGSVKFADDINNEEFMSPPPSSKQRNTSTDMLHTPPSSTNNNSSTRTPTTPSSGNNNNNNIPKKPSGGNTPTNVLQKMSNFFGGF